MGLSDLAWSSISLARKRLEVFFIIFFRCGLGMTTLKAPDEGGCEKKTKCQGPNQVPNNCVGFNVGAPHAPMLLGKQGATYTVDVSFVQWSILCRTAWNQAF